MHIISGARLNNIIGYGSSCWSFVNSARSFFNLLLICACETSSLVHMFISCRVYIWKKATAETMKETAKTLKANKSRRQEFEGGRENSVLVTPTKKQGKKGPLSKKKASLMYMSILLVGV